jgi:hypothetical protein
MRSKNFRDLKIEIDNMLLDKQKTIINNNQMDENGISMDLGRLNFSMNKNEETKINE